MADQSWDDQFKSFLKRAGDDLKKMGEDLRTEAQKLIEKVQDPQTQQKVRARAREVGTWAKQTVSDVADLVEKGAQKAEDAVRGVAQKGVGPVKGPRAQPKSEPKVETRTTATASTASGEPTPRAGTATAKKAGAASKTIGPKKRPAGGAPKKKPTVTKKTIGRKPKA